MYKFSNRSKERLATCREPLQQVMNRAIELSVVDFGISEGIRTVERQAELYAEGKSQTMSSKHISGMAVDVYAWVHGGVSWQHKYYFEIADAVKQASLELKIPIRWGGAWHIKDIGTSFFHAQAMYIDYADYKKGLNQTPFYDCVHFELT